MEELCIGKFYVSFYVVESRSILSALKEMEFVPLSVKCLGYQHEYEYIGTSPLFKPIRLGNVVPKYTITIDKSNESSIKVSADIAE